MPFGMCTTTVNSAFPQSSQRHVDADPKNGCHLEKEPAETHGFAWYFAWVCLKMLG